MPAGNIVFRLCMCLLIWSEEEPNLEEQRPLWWVGLKGFTDFQNMGSKRGVLQLRASERYNLPAVWLQLRRDDLHIALRVLKAWTTGQLELVDPRRSSFVGECRKSLECPEILELQGLDLDGRGQLLDRRI